MCCVVRKWKFNVHQFYIRQFSGNVEWLSLWATFVFQMYLSSCKEIHEFEIEFKLFEAYHSAEKRSFTAKQKAKTDYLECCSASGIAFVLYWQLISPLPQGISTSISDHELCSVCTMIDQGTNKRTSIMILHFNLQSWWKYEAQL